MTTPSVTFPVTHGEPDFTFSRDYRGSGRRPRMEIVGSAGTRDLDRPRGGWKEWVVVVVLSYRMGRYLMSEMS
jgi:hypothetical protein